MTNTKTPAAPTLADDLREMMRVWDRLTETARACFPGDSDRRIEWIVRASMDRALDLDGYRPTGKRGTNIATGLEAIELRHGDHACRRWLLSNGLVVEE
jgi:hypothetical protein